MLEAEVRLQGPDHPHVLMTRRCLARDIAARGNHAAAETELRQLLEAEQGSLDRTTLRALITRSDLAQLAAARGDHAAAEAELRDVLEAQQRILRPGPPFQSSRSTHAC